MTSGGRQWKAWTVDYTDIADYDDGEKCVICLTPRQAIAIVGHMQAMYWQTRWENLPIGFDLFTWVSDIERELLMASCNQSQMQQLIDCICQLQISITNQNLVDAGNNAPVIPPDDPSANLPALEPPADDFPAQQRLDAAICDASKLLIDMIFETIKIGQEARCNTDNDPDWADIGANVSSGALAVAALPFAALSSPAIIGVAIGAAAFAIGDEIFDFDIVPGEDNCPPPDFPQSVIDAYACQLWQYVSENGKQYDVVKQAFDCTNPQAVARWNDIYPTGLFGDILDNSTRSILSEFIAKPQLYQQYIALMADMAGFDYTSPDLCADCGQCDVSTERVIEEWTDSAIVSVEPVGTVISNSRRSWPAGTTVQIVFDKVYCIQKINVELVRGPTSSSPNELTFVVGSDDLIDATGSFGSQDIEVNPSGALAKRFTITSNASPNDMTLDLNDTLPNGITIREPLPYYDCS